MAKSRLPTPRLLGVIAVAGAASTAAWGESGQTYKLHLLWEHNESLAVPLEVEDATSFLSFQTNYTETKGEICHTRNFTKPASPPPSRIRWELQMARL